MRALAAGVVLILVQATAYAAQAEECKMDRAVFLGGKLPVSISVEIADDAAERAQGLMMRRDLAARHGMLFVYPTAQPVAFWMRNTLIPLDMIFIDAQGTVRHIHPMAKPLDDTSIPGALPADPDPDRLMVLEIGGGQAAIQGIKPGMVLAHPDIPQQTARAPCAALN